jgi:hypothetical protein
MTRTHTNCGKMEMKKKKKMKKENLLSLHILLGVVELPGRALQSR